MRLVVWLLVFVGACLVVSASTVSDGVFTASGSGTVVKIPETMFLDSIAGDSVYINITNIFLNYSLFADGSLVESADNQYHNYSFGNGKEYSFVVAPEDPPSGGGGGGAATQDYFFIVNKDSVVFSVYENETYEDSLVIINAAGKDLVITTDSPSAIIEEVFGVKKGGSVEKPFTIKGLAVGDYETYISLSSNDHHERVTITYKVLEKPTSNISLRIINHFEELVVEKGELLTAVYELVNDGDDAVTITNNDLLLIPKTTTINPQEHANFTLSFTPLTAGSFKKTIYYQAITEDYAEGRYVRIPYIVTLNGTIGSACTINSDCTNNNCFGGFCTTIGASTDDSLFSNENYVTMIIVVIIIASLIAIIKDRPKKKVVAQEPENPWAR